MRWWFLLLGLGMLLAACGPSSSEAAKSLGGDSSSREPAPPARSNTPTSPADETPPPGAVREFRTDFSIHSVPLSEFQSGGPPKDGIPALDHPRFVSPAEADAWLAPREPVILFAHKGAVRAYPIQILIWHEIVNDVVGGEPVLITFCPLCNTAIAFSRVVNGETLDFGTTGRLRFSNLVMYDRQTESWWQQATGEALVGTLTGTRLQPLPAAIVAWETFRNTYPDGEVLSRETGYNRPYGRNPYAGYDSVDNVPFLYQGPETPDLLPPMARVLTLEIGGEAVAYPFRTLEEVGVVNDIVGGEPVVVFWAPGVASPLDTTSTATGRDVGTALAFSRRVGTQTLTFTSHGAEFFDHETGTRWSALGEGLEGPLAGQQLRLLPAIPHFWFSWAAFRPETRVYRSAP